MAVIRKDKYLKDIATRIGRGSMFFEMEDRPSVMMGGREVFVGSIGYDNLCGEMTYTVSNSRGDVLPTAHGVRRLVELDVRTLSQLSGLVGEYQRLRQSRTQNLVNLETRMRSLEPKRPGRGLTL